MKKIKVFAKTMLVKYGAAVATCAFTFAAISANTSCGLPFYEHKEPSGLKRFKKYAE